MYTSARERDLHEIVIATQVGRAWCLIAVWSAIAVATLICFTSQAIGGGIGTVATIALLSLAAFATFVAYQNCSGELDYIEISAKSLLYSMQDDHDYDGCTHTSTHGR